MTETQRVECCFDGCTLELIELDSSGGRTLSPHVICLVCRTIILCPEHFETLQQAGSYPCPACGAEDWDVVHVPGHTNQANEKTSVGVEPIYLHAHRSRSRAWANALVSSPSGSGWQSRLLGERHELYSDGEPTWAAASQCRERIALVYETEHGENILDIHGAAARPWKVRNEAPLGVQTVAFLERDRLVASQIRHDGSLELFELRLESNYLIASRRILKLGENRVDGGVSPLLVAPRNQVFAVRRGGAHLSLDRINLETGEIEVSTPLDFEPDRLVLGPKGHVLVAALGGPVALAKGERLVCLFENFDLVDAIFDERGQLWLTGPNDGLTLNLQDGSSIERTWSRTVLGLANPRLETESVVSQL